MQITYFNITGKVLFVGSFASVLKDLRNKCKYVLSTEVLRNIHICIISKNISREFFIITLYRNNDFNKCTTQFIEFYWELVKKYLFYLVIKRFLDFKGITIFAPKFFAHVPSVLSLTIHPHESRFSWSQISCHWFPARCERSFRLARTSSSASPAPAPEEAPLFLASLFLLELVQNICSGGWRCANVSRDFSWHRSCNCNAHSGGATSQLLSPVTSIQYPSASSKCPTPLAQVRAEASSHLRQLPLISASFHGCVDIFLIRFAAEKKEERVKSDRKTCSGISSGFTSSSPGCVLRW